MSLVQWKNSILLTSAVILITLLTSSCREQSRQQESLAEGQLEGQEVTVILGSLPDRTGRYIGTYDEVSNVSLTYSRSDGLGVVDTIELQWIETASGSLTPTSAWVGTLENVIPGANYNFAAVAYDKPTDTEIADCRVQIDLGYASSDPGYDPSLWGTCYRNYFNYEPYATPIQYSDGINEYFNVNLFEGSVDNFQIQAGANALQLRMIPKLKQEAEAGLMPYISKVERPDRYSAAENLLFVVEFKGPQGYDIELKGTIQGTCTEGETTEGCQSVLGEITFEDKDESGLIQICDRVTGDCTGDSNILAHNYTIGRYQLPNKPPAQLSVTIVLSQRDGFGLELLGLSNEIRFTMNSDTFGQNSQLVFMPTLNDISLVYEMASDRADLSYDFQVQGLSSEIEIYANLDYQEATPLGFPAPYLKIGNTADNQPEKTLSGLIDKNDLYSAKLKLNFVHTPTGFVYATEYPLPAYGKAKHGLPPLNWINLLRDGICNHCDLQNIGNLATPVNWRPFHTWGDPDRDGTRGFPSVAYEVWEDIGEDNDPTNDVLDDDGNLNDPDYFKPTGDPAELHGGYLKFATLENSNLNGVSFTNVNFQGANLRDVTITDSVFDGSLFTNALIYNTTFTNSTIHRAVFTTEDNSPTTQDLPYTDLAFSLTQGDNLTMTGLTTKLDIQNSMFQNLQMNNNLIYQSNFDGMTVRGQFQNNDVVQSDISASDFDGANLDNTSFISTSFTGVSMKGADLSSTWFDQNSGTSLYGVACDLNTTLPIYGNMSCDDQILDFAAEDSSREYVLSLPSGKSRASYLYENDADSFRLAVTDPRSISIEINSIDPNINFSLRKSSNISSQINPTNSGTKTTIREDENGNPINYNTTIKYYTGLPELTSPEYYLVYVTGGTGVFYLYSYYD